MSALQIVELLAGAVALVLIGVGLLASRRLLNRARIDSERIVAEARIEAESRASEILVAAQEKQISIEEDAERRDAEIEAREAAVEAKSRQLEQDLASLDRQRRDLERRAAVMNRNEDKAREALASALAEQAQARRTLERVAGLTAEEARAELVRSVEQDARRDAARIARQIEDEARIRAERDASQLVVTACQRLSLREAVESSVSFVQLPSDEMKGRIIGREGRNIRALEFATGIDVIIDDTPQAILISSFDPVRREIARVAIERLIQDGRIHPAKIEEVVAQVVAEFDALTEEAGSQAAFNLGMAELGPRLARLVGRMKFRYHRGHNLLQHCTEVALIAAHMAGELGARSDVVRRAGLFHEIARVDENATGHTTMASAEIAARLGEKDDVVHAIQSLHPDVDAKTVEAILLRTANRISDNRPGARKDNLDLFIERMKRLEAVAAAFPGVVQAYAVRAGKELRVIVDTASTTDEGAYVLAKEIARAVEKELDYPSQIKISVVRETRAVQYAV